MQRYKSIFREVYPGFETFLINQPTQKPIRSRKPRTVKPKMVKPVKQYEWGFDLTEISDTNWIKCLKLVGIPPMADLRKPFPQANHSIWVWEGNGIKVHTGNNPITGEYRTPGQRDNEVGYASYIGVYGDKDKVTKFAKAVSKLATFIKEENPGKSPYI
jgi:hypothetical protein